MVTINDLNRYLLKLGFVNESVKNSHRLYRHDPSGTLIILAEGDDLAIRREDLISIRRHLVENGLVSEAEFHRFERSGVEIGNESPFGINDADMP